MNTNTMTRRTRTLAVATLAGASLLASAGVSAGEFKGEMHDAWLDGRVETAYTLNRHLNPFSIDTKVENGVVTLTGAVESDIDRDLAEQIALGVNGVTDVDNQLTIKTNARITAEDTSERSFAQVVDDASTTAAVKSKLLVNSNTKGMQIDVDTKNDVVTLSGEVASNQEKQLIEQIARNTQDVQRVENRLRVQGS